MGTYNWGTWLVEVVIAIFFISGFVVFYNQEWIPFLNRNHHYAQKQRQRLTRGGMTAFIFVMAIFFQFAAIIDPINSTTYLNLILYALAIPLMDDQMGGKEYLVRALGLMVFWVYNDPVFSWTFSASLVNLVVILTIIYKWNRQITDHWWADLGMSFWLGINFWLTQTQLTREYLVMGIAMFGMMSIFNFFYWTSARRNEVEQSQLMHQVNYDGLTRIRNFSSFDADGKLLMQTRSRTEPLTLVMFDIDHFKQVNDSYGHMAGNAVLVGVAERVTQILADSTMDDYSFYRTGGEEFNIIFGHHTPEQVMELVEEFWTQIREAKFYYEDDAMQITLSVGVSQRQAADPDFTALYQRADASLYHSKQSGRDTITVENQTFRSHHHNVASLTYRFFTQPIVDVATGKTLRHELLLRMYHPRFKQWQLPRVFEISAATQIELIKNILPQLDVKKISINLTKDQFADPDTAHQLVAYFQSEPELVAMIVEITHVPTAAVMHQMSQIYHAGGVELAIDDVESDNLYDKVAPLLTDVDCLKFAVQNLRQERETAEIWEQVAFWQELAAQNQLKFAVEGIETDQDVAMMKQLSIEWAQGYYYSKPALPKLD